MTGNEIALMYQGGTDRLLQAFDTREVTPEQVRDRLSELGRADPESGHGWEDEFVAAVLTAIRDGHADPVRLAGDALIVTSADFPRWYA
ncbi:MULTISPECIES: hypothetical protein [Prauserella salsuginis group]|uniref:Uncharacterized protein n=2 Tax=Prauserella salsuginis group TaxID=2893672 RepID=A0A839XZ25_9PSEU|nr:MULTISPECIES: hypothetical protein [Prauserella salsuginis group]MBB3666378.1 hypothetical protein [Prauserella sediminis]MCR3719167.1 hypothetical protein [Prauserella flava]MCR3735820.1 hypothetical protein [Prauserella salsuginis]